MKRGWQAAVAVLLLLFAFFAFESLRLSLRDALAVFLLIQLHRQPASETLTFELRPVALVLAGLVVASAALEAVGFRIAMLVLLPYLLIVLGTRNWLAIALFSLAGSFGVYHVFSGFLKVPLP